MEGRTHIGAHFGELGFGEGRMDRIGRIGEFDERARGHASAFVIFDHGRADHEALIVPRDDINRTARMQQTERAGNTGRDDHSAADAGGVNCGKWSQVA